MDKDQDKNNTESQFGLFSDIQDKAIYELPLNERIRNFLRLEFLFQLVSYSISKPEEWDNRQCVSNLIDISELLNRTDIKAELYKELDKHISLLQTLKKNPQVDGEVLNEMLNRLQDSHNQLTNPAYHPGQNINEDELISSIKQRSSIAGGACNFDLPSYHHWLSKNSSERKFQLNQWFDDLKYMKNAINLVLKILRSGSEATKETAPEGFFQYSLDQNKPIQLIRILLPVGNSSFPEISGGKHRFSVRFLEQNSTRERPIQIGHNIDFELQCCN
ncbi:MAG: cell division protein ZapD [Gammaproteobacteria bacterium]